LALYIESDNSGQVARAFACKASKLGLILSGSYLMLLMLYVQLAEGKETVRGLYLVKTTAINSVLALYNRS